MACPITITKFIGTISLGLQTGYSFSSAAVALPSLNLLPTAKNASKALNNVKRLNRKHAFRQANITNTCLLFAYGLSPRHRKHPYLLWMCVMSTMASYGVDYWFHRQDGFTAWIQGILQDIGGMAPGSPNGQKKEDDIVVVEAEEDFNGESIRKDMSSERYLQLARMLFAGLGFGMGIVGLWGERRP